MSASTLTLTVVLLYVLVGIGVGAMLHFRGRDGAVAGSALAVWPLLLPLLGNAPPRAAVGGPFAGRIASTFRALLDALGDPSAGDAPWDEDVVPLRAALQEADQRVAFADRLLADAGADETRTVTRLREARERTAREIEDVLAGVVELRLQVGLLALSGNAVAVRDQLRAFHARARALAEVSDLAIG